MHHPDRGGNTAFMQELNKAFEILSSKEKTAEFASDQDATIDALAVPLCACGCFECSSFVEQGCQEQAVVSAKLVISPALRKTVRGLCSRMGASHSFALRRIWGRS